eukprot:SM000226S07408  [mRNA]  locus=s226:195779:196801:+ [translate_table: standard]
MEFALPGLDAQLHHQHQHGHAQHHHQLPPLEHAGLGVIPVALQANMHMSHQHLELAAAAGGDLPKLEVDDPVAQPPGQTPQPQLQQAAQQPLPSPLYVDSPPPPSQQRHLDLGPGLELPKMEASMSPPLVPSTEEPQRFIDPPTQPLPLPEIGRLVEAVKGAGPTLLEFITQEAGAAAAKVAAAASAVGPPLPQWTNQPPSLDPNADPPMPPFSHSLTA